MDISLPIRNEFGTGVVNSSLEMALENYLKPDILSGDNYEFLIKDEFQWSSWAMPKGPDGKLDHNIALTGPDFVDFVDHLVVYYL